MTGAPSRRMLAYTVRLRCCLLLFPEPPDFRIPHSGDLRKSPQQATAPPEFRSVQQEIDENDQQNQSQNNLGYKAERRRQWYERYDPPSDAKDPEPGLTN